MSLGSDMKFKVASQGLASNKRQMTGKTICIRSDEGSMIETPALETFMVANLH